jgi:hypothetical protein
VVRKLIFKKIKFCIGEGAVSSSHFQKGKLEAEKKILRISHECADITKDRGYMFEIMKNKKKIIWTVVSDHQPVNPVQSQSSAYLGSQKQEIFDNLEKSKLPLADLFLYLMFKDGEWKRWLRTMNQSISALNISNTCSIKQFSPKELRWSI